jgi:hypothetical protein
MTPAQYKNERQKRGTQQGVAALLGVHYRTVQRREAGDIAITNEAMLAITSLNLPRKRNKSNDQGEAQPE